MTLRNSFDSDTGITVLLKIGKQDCNFDRSVGQATARSSLEQEVRSSKLGW